MATGDRGRGGDQLPRDWDAEYDGTPPWDIGRPQRPFVALAAAGRIRGRVLDLGCGTGEHALLAAEHGADAIGIDIAPAAIDKAREKAEGRGLGARFVAGDALTADELGESFDVVLDCGFFHVLPHPDRARLTEMLRRVLAPDGHYFVLCFSDAVPGESGPRRISRDEIHDTFGDGLTVESIEATYIEATLTPQPIPAWLVDIVRTDG